MNARHNLDYASSSRNVKPMALLRALLRWCGVVTALAFILGLTFFFTLDWTFNDNGSAEQVAIEGRMILSIFLGFLGSALIVGFISLVRICVLAQRPRAE